MILGNQPSSRVPQDGRTATDEVPAGTWAGLNAALWGLLTGSVYVIVATVVVHTVSGRPWWGSLLTVVLWLATLSLGLAAVSVDSHAWNFRRVRMSTCMLVFVSICAYLVPVRTVVLHMVANDPEYPLWIYLIVLIGLHFFITVSVTARLCNALLWFVNRARTIRWR